MKIILFSLIASILLMASSLGGASIIRKRAAETITAHCEGNNPCGWAVYTPFTRNVEYFMKNSCVCPPEKFCTRTDDDISVSAFVYRCRERTSSTTKAP